MSKLISIIIPAKNAQKYLKEAISGILKQQMNTQIIVINDGSTDETPQIAKEMGCLVITHPQSKGQVAAKNTGLKHAEGEYVMFHDADDVLNDSVLKKMYDILENDSSISAVMGKVQDFISPDTTDNTSQIKKEPYYGLFTGAVLIRRSVFDQIGPFDESVHTGEIIEWKNKMDANHLAIQKMDLVTTNRRIHDHNFGKTNRLTEFKNYAQILRQRLKKT